MSASRQVWKPVVLLMVLSPLLAEVFSGSMPVTDYLGPGILFPFTIFVYGLPVLVLRELAAHRRMGLLGLWCLGIVYGLFNEGLISETLYHPLDPANPAYGEYGLVAGLRIPWALFILPWHGIFSLVTPVVLVGLLFPGQAGRPWLPKRATVVLAVVTGGLAIARFVFWGESQGVQDRATFLLHIGVVLAAGLAAVLVAVRLPRVPRVVPGSGVRGGDGSPWWPFAAGGALYALWFAGTEMLTAVVRAPWPVTVLYTSVVVVAVLVAASRLREVTAPAAAGFVLGAGAAQATVTVLVNGLLVGDAFRSVSGVIFIAVYLTALGGVAWRFRRPSLDPA